MHAEHFHRRSIRLPEYDYSQAGLYYLTIRTHQPVQLFGRVVDGKMQLNSLGQIAHDEWLRTADVRSNVVLVEFVVMPNHVHVLFWIVDDLIRPDTPVACPDGQRIRRFGESVPGSVSAIMRQYKSLVTKQINRILNTPVASVWQRNFYERVVRDEREANNTRRCIVENPMQWHLDRNNLANM